ncbi:MAG: hypothetical protein F6K55_08350 [Moorea sp. SIO4A3]|nr:hypothetical protein [Moorena sp. SIO4A3]
MSLAKIPIELINSCLLPLASCLLPLASCLFPIKNHDVPFLLTLNAVR